MKVQVVPVTPFEQNCSVLVCEKTMAAAVVDPGGDLDRIIEAVRQLGAHVEKIFVTHGHVDHCAGAASLAARLGVPIEGPHPDDDFWIQNLPEAARQYGFAPASGFVPSRWLQDGDTVRFGEQTLEVIHCPGHTPGSVVFFHRPDQVAFVGDVIFAGSIGRTDFPRGNHADLIHSIRAKLWPLGNDVRFVPGHGPDSTFGRERKVNPYVSDAVLAKSLT